MSTENLASFNAYHFVSENPSLSLPELVEKFLDTAELASQNIINNYLLSNNDIFKNHIKTTAYFDSIGLDTKLIYKQAGLDLDEIRKKQYAEPPAKRQKTV